MKLISKLTLVFAMGIALAGCQEDCDPWLLPMKDVISVIIRNNNGTAFINYANSALPDSVKVTNLANNALVARSLLGDSVLEIQDYNVANGAVTRFKIQKGNVLKPDTLEVTVAERSVNDNCGTPYMVPRFSSMKVNNTTLCTNCTANLAQVYVRP